MKVRKAFSAALLSAGVILGSLLPLGSGTASADPCTGTWSIGIGGLNDNSSSVFWGGVNQPVGYNSWDPASGVREIDRLFWSHRDQCPDDHIKLIGHSEGAGVLHAWVTDHQWVDNANAVLLADPKRDAGPGGPGLASTPGSGILGWPLAGTDGFFGSFPVLSVCRWDDQICNTDAGWWGYVNGHHGWYDFNAGDYSDWDSGVWMQ